MGTFSRGELGILREVINLVVDECLRVILSCHKDIDNVHLEYRYSIEDFHPTFRCRVRESIEASIDRAIEFPDIVLTPGSEWGDAFDSIKSLAEKVAVKKFYAKGQDEFKVKWEWCSGSWRFFLWPKRKEFSASSDIHQGLADDISFAVNRTW